MRFSDIFYLLRVIGPVAFLGSLVGCASRPPLESYPRTQVERPYTLAKGIATWHVGAVADFAKDEAGNNHTIYPIPNPLIWDQSLSDTWQLTWAPLPMVLKHQFAYDESGYIGASIGLPFGYSSSVGTFLQPFASLDMRHKFEKSFALDGAVDYGRTIWLNGNSRPYAWAAGAQVLAFFQLNSQVAISVGPRVNVANAVIFYTNLFSGESSSRSKTTTTYPLLANFLWNLHRQWDFEANYRASFLGEKNGAYDHTIAAQFIHFW